MSKDVLLVIMIVCGVCALAMFIWFFVLVLSKDKDIKVDENKQEEIKENKEENLEKVEETKEEVKEEIKEESKEEIKEEVHEEVKEETHEEINVEETKVEETKVEEKQEEEVMEVTPVVHEEKEEVHSNETELINVTINEKNYIFLANGNKVTEGEHIKLELNGKYYPAVIAKANYYRDISTLNNPPRNLVIVKE